MPRMQRRKPIMGEYKKLWWLLLAVLALTFGVLGWSGVEIYRQVPPIPEKVITVSNMVLMTKDDILNGQTAWQSTGGMQVGSVWGHGSYQAPDRSEEHTSELQSLMRNSYAVFCLKTKKNTHDD